ncbi:MAG: MoxR family ATPase [Pirellulales bacterium]
MTVSSSAASGLDELRSNIGKAVLGKPTAVKLVITALMAGEHILLEDVPGVGKTLIAKAIAKSISGKFTRLQFTPDLLPSDITGSSVYNATTGDFTFHPGPVFANVVLADEINRAPPRTQSALLEAMGEGQVSVDGETHRLPNPLLVIATQNPFEFEGTYLLPESQLDRFLLRITVGYPAREHELDLLTSHRTGEPVDQLSPVIELDQIMQLQRQAREVHVETSLANYLLDIVHATRDSAAIQVGVSTRGTLAFYRSAQAFAMISGRDHVVPDDIKGLAVPVLAHRIVPRGMLPGADRSAAEDVVNQVLGSVRVPV